MTTLYYDLPIEDFRYTQQGFNVSGKGQGRLPNVSGEAMCSSSDDISTIGDGTWWGCWDYGKIRRVNYFLKISRPINPISRIRFLLMHGWERLILSGLTAILQW